MFITVGPMKKAVSGEREKGGHVLRDTQPRPVRSSLATSHFGLFLVFGGCAHLTLQMVFGTKPPPPPPLVFGGCAFLPFSLGPPGDCPWKH